MASTYMTPGVYIEEKDAFPNSAVAVETAVPVFIGYTEKADLYSNSLLNKPTRITSFAEYLERFGAGFKAKYTITKVTSDDDKKKAALHVENTIIVGADTWYVDIAKDNTLYLFDSIRMFYANGGGPCYIHSVGLYGGKASLEVLSTDFTGSTDNPVSAFDILKKEPEPTLVVIPDAIALGDGAYNTVYTTALQHCADTQSRFAILDLAQQSPVDQTSDIVGKFRDDIGINALNYGAAYYPWLKTALVQPTEVDLDNIDLGAVAAADFFPEAAAKQVLAKYDTDSKAAADAIKTAQDALAAAKTPEDVAKATADLAKANDQPKKIKDSFLQSLKAVSPTYGAVLEKIRTKMNELPPSGAMAGLYTMVDASRGVWKAPANVSVNLVNAPSVNISSEEQQSLNVDVMAGKSINVIRAFPGIGTLVWGGRTLDGNSQDWRYINVRRTLIMIEQSIKLAARAYVFEPNDANTWITVKSMIDNFLTNLWKQGALAGAVPEQAFDVQIGLGSTMTANDILDGKMLVTVKVAIVRPAEFIIITFQQQMQQS
ncbi:phage tail protein [Mucilaginibacter sp. PPCGB 2223]|uniref:phage tail sheath C-terminal domain-containing protein n=1 Tax=Mucilaginibacter sp. PPCGB 2223 TaxID=1886027 RepID=UPI000825F6E4|nr:phage tail sheath C-terminal domain-containing protein [Mucilaginibacter sp. PPCGB 2223]OCX53143.1 phage tail protein [Mucilaginibacter sp. PPCGB 2223]